MRTAQIDLTRGPIARRSWQFALPLMLGDLLQQCYGLVDTWCVGRYIGEEALAAVGASYTLMTFLTSVVIGLCLGCNAFFGMAWGKRDEALLRRGAAMAFAGIGLLSLILTVAVSLWVEPIVTVLRVPEGPAEGCEIYLRWVFLGIPFSFLYNYSANLLRGIGDSVAPLIFLALSVTADIVLDLFFVIALRLGIAGAAQATVISQVLSGVGLTAYALARYRSVWPRKGDWRFDRGIFRMIAPLSGFTCLQQSVMNFGILMVQGLVNSFGTAVMAAFTVAVKIDTLAYMPVQDLGNAFSTFVAQNRGAGQGERIRSGVRVMLLSVTAFCAVISSLVCLLAPRLMAIFVDPAQTEIVQIGVGYLRIEGAFYLGIGILFLLYGFYRSIGQPWMSLVLTVLSLGTRVLLAYALSPALGVTMIWWAIPIGWALADAVGLIYGVRRYGRQIHAAD